MPELSLPALNLVVGRDHYMSTTKAWVSILSAQLTVTSQAASLLTLLEGVTTDLTDQATGCTPAPNGSIKSFSGTIVIPTAAKGTNHIAEDSSVEFTATVGTNPVAITDDGDGALTGTNVTGTINYATGAWTLVWGGGGNGPDNSSTIVVDYTYYCVFGATDIQGLWLYPAADIRATYDGVTAPTASTGILLKEGESIFLSAQPALISKMQVITSTTALLDIEVLV